MIDFNKLTNQAQEIMFSCPTTDGKVSKYTA